MSVSISRYFYIKQLTTFFFIEKYINEENYQTMLLLGSTDQNKVLKSERKIKFYTLLPSHAKYLRGHLKVISSFQRYIFVIIRKGSKWWRKCKKITFNWFLDDSLSDYFISSSYMKSRVRLEKRAKDWKPKYIILNKLDLPLTILSLLWPSYQLNLSTFQFQIFSLITKWNWNLITIESL